MDLEILVTDYQTAKAAEDTATAERRRLATLIADALEHPIEGSKTHTVGGVKVMVKGTVNRKVDWPLFLECCAMRPQIAPPYIETQKLDMKGMQWVEENQPEFYRALCQAVTEKPGAVSVTVKGGG